MKNLLTGVTALALSLFSLSSVSPAQAASQVYWVSQVNAELGVGSGESCSQPDFYVDNTTDYFNDALNAILGDADLGEDIEIVVCAAEDQYDTDADSNYVDFNDADTDVTLTVTGSTQNFDDVVVDGMTLNQIFAFSDVNVTLANMTFTRAETSGDGAVLELVSLDDDTLEVALRNVEVADSDTDDEGAIYVEGALSVVRSSFYDNDSGEDGGAIWANGVVRVISSYFEGNYSDDDGGAIWAEGELSVRGSTFLDNDADEEGGSINSDACFGSVSIRANTFEGSDAASSGGAINIDDDCDDEYPNPTLNFSRNKFVENSADYAGGAVDIDVNDATNVVFRSNRFVGNSVNDAGGEGGAVWVAYARILGNTFARNAAACGGGVFFETSLYGTVKFNGFRGNEVTGPIRGRNVASQCDVIEP